jgi:flavorubredoxin
VQTLLKKASGLEIETICPLHGPFLRGDLSHFLEKYSIWSSYQPESHGVLVAYASIHGNTAEAAKQVAEALTQAGETVVLTDLARDDMAEAVANAFQYDRVVLAASSYDGGVFPPMEEFLLHLKAKNYQNRKVALIENGSWAPSAKKVMLSYLENMKQVTVLEPTVTIRSTVNAETETALQALAAAVKEA